MISIIVCSINPDLLTQLKSNIATTIGVLHEIISINNAENSRGICEIYNEGLKRTRFDIICFCHEDILFEINNWGENLSALINANKEIGLVGTAGAVYKSRYPGSWTSVPGKYYRINMIQQRKDGTRSDHVLLDPGIFSEVAVIDGCFIAGKKEFFYQFPWNEQLLKGFHLYDLDMSIRAGQQYKVVVSSQIKIAHLSEGEFGRSWLKEAQRFHRHYQHMLPVSKGGLKKSEQKELEYFALRAYVVTLIRLKEPFLLIISFIGKGFLLFPFRRQNLSLLKQLARGL